MCVLAFGIVIYDPIPDFGPGQKLVTF